MRKYIGFVSGLYLYFCYVATSSVAYGAVTLYGQSFYQSPVTAVPGQPLMLPGFGFSTDNMVVYQAMQDTTKALTPPFVLPEEVGPSLGVARIISSADVPHSLTVQWPEVTEKDKSYAIWVRDSRGEWSNAISVNDARPLWITPAFVYESARIGTLPRYIKVVGRNLHPAPGDQTRVKLVNVAAQANEVVLVAENDSDPTTMVEQYVAKVMLPSSLKQGEYKVLVARDGKSWVPIQGQQLVVHQDPALQKDFNISSFGCHANDGLDDSDCIRKAVAEAGRFTKGGAVIVLGEGVWNLNQRNDKSIVFPQGVSLKGAGAHRTVLVKGSAQNGVSSPRSTAWFILQGRNSVRGITFKDETIYHSAKNQGAVLQLGNRRQRGEDVVASNISNIIIENNVFDKPFRAITGGLPIDRLFVIHNEFGAFESAILLDGLPAGSRFPFHVDDSIIVDNVFKPGSYMDVSTGQGTIATQIGASRRLDFSGNVVDGQSTDYFYDPKNDPRGWRAAFFWHMRNNHEMLLVSQNTATCTGDKTGDGESFSFDNNQNSFGFASAQPVISATKDTVTVPGPMQTRRKGGRLPPGFFNEHWVQVADGSGVGQVRRIVSYEEQDDRVKVTVTPPWDVKPGKDGRITIGLEFWQILVLDNHVDHRKPLCLKSNRRKASNKPYGAGSIALWAQAADSVIAGNSQMGANGIRLHPFYSAAGAECPKCSASSMLQYFVEVRGNRVEGEYDWDSDCSWSGITISSGASPAASAPPPAIAYGLIVAGNTVIQADGFSGGAISIAPSWWDGPRAYSASLVRNTLINNNLIKNMEGAIKDASCNRGLVSRFAIVLASPTARNTVITSNVCINTDKDPLSDKGKNTLVVQDPADPRNCEY